MFENSRTWRRIGGEPDKAIRIHLGYVPEIEVDEERDKRHLRWAIVAAVVAHVALFLVTVPYEPRRPQWQAPQRAVFAVRQLQFKRPDALPQQALPQPRQTARKVPIPDPTPDDPEPLRLEEVELPRIDIEAPDVGIDDFFIPDGPPARRSGGPQPLRVGGDVVPPVKLSGDTPVYTEEARQGRVQGVVILEAIIDELGDVENVTVLKGLPLGLTETALLATRDWKFKPATRDGTPVPVFYNLTVRFSLQ
jgi:periplasmic protein TonB